MRLEGKEGENHVERFFAAVVYYLLLALVLIGALQTVGLTQVAAPIQSVVDSLAGALPLIFKAGAIMAVAYAAGRILQIIITRAMNSAGLDTRFAELSATSEDEGEEAAKEARAFSENAGMVIYWLVMLVGLAGAFEALQIGPLADPLRNAMDEVIGILPDLGVAVLLVIVGFVLGRIARAALQNLLQGIGFDKLVTRVKLDALFGEWKPSAVAGVLAMAFIMIQAVIAALNKLGLSTLADPLTDMMGRFWNLLPDLGIALVIGVAGVAIGKVVRGVVTGALKNWDFDGVLGRLGLGRFTQHSEELDEPSEVVGLIAQIAVVLMAAAQVLDHLGLHTWEVYVSGALSYGLQNVVVSIFIIGAGFAIGNYVQGIIAAGDKPDEPSRWLGAVARYAVLVFAFTMALRHLEIAEDFVLVSFALLFGALCLAMALAFGLGSRDVAEEIVRQQYARIRKELEKSEAVEAEEEP